MRQHTLLLMSVSARSLGLMTLAHVNKGCYRQRNDCVYRRWPIKPKQYSNNIEFFTGRFTR